MHMCNDDQFMTFGDRILDPMGVLLPNLVLSLVTVQAGSKWYRSDNSGIGPACWAGDHKQSKSA
jgi:hypothetical protein